MSISKAVVLCCALMGAQAVSAQEVSVDAGRVLVTHNPPEYKILGVNLSVPPDPYRTVLHNPPDCKTLTNDLSIPPDPYIAADRTTVVSKTICADVMHNPPGY